MLASTVDERGGVGLFECAMAGGVSVIHIEPNSMADNFGDGAVRDLAWCSAEHAHVGGGEQLAVVTDGHVWVHRVVVSVMPAVTGASATLLHKLPLPKGSQPISSLCWSLPSATLLPAALVLVRPSTPALMLTLPHGEKSYSYSECSSAWTCPEALAWAHKRGFLGPSSPTKSLHGGVENVTSLATCRVSACLAALVVLSAPAVAAPATATAPATALASKISPSEILWPGQRQKKEDEDGGGGRKLISEISVSPNDAAEPEDDESGTIPCGAPPPQPQQCRASPFPHALPGTSLIDALRVPPAEALPSTGLFLPLFPDPLNTLPRPGENDLFRPEQNLNVCLLLRQEGDGVGCKVDLASPSHPHSYTSSLRGRLDISALWVNSAGSREGYFCLASSDVRGAAILVCTFNFDGGAAKCFECALPAPWYCRGLRLWPQPNGSPPRLLALAVTSAPTATASLASASAIRTGPLALLQYRLSSPPSPPCPFPSSPRRIDAQMADLRSRPHGGSDGISEPEAESFEKRCIDLFSCVKDQLAAQSRAISELSSKVDALSNKIDSFSCSQRK